MSSLQKFHRRTASFGPLPPFPTVGSGNAVIGYYSGISGDGISKLITYPNSTVGAWGSYGTVRGTTSTTNGLANTNTLYAFGSAAHPAAYYCKTLTLGGYNTWYLPAYNELLTMYSNKSVTPAYAGRHWSSTEASGTYAGKYAQIIQFANGNYEYFNKSSTALSCRAVRRTTN